MNPAYHSSTSSRSLSIISLLCHKLCHLSSRLLSQHNHSLQASLTHQPDFVNRISSLPATDAHAQLVSTRHFYRAGHSICELSLIPSPNGFIARQSKDLKIIILCTVDSHSRMRIPG